MGLVRAQPDLERRAFALRHLYVYPKLRLAYTYTPKNACTSFKRTFGRAQGWLSDDSPAAHDMTVSWWLSGLARYPSSDERILVVRDPFDRVLSAYLNRFLTSDAAAAGHAMRTGLGDSLAAGATKDDVTFQDFVGYLSRTPGKLLNEHWRPQSDFLLGSYTRLLRFEHLAEDTQFLSQRGLSLQQARGHSTSALRQDLGAGWGTAPAKRLRRMRQRRGVLPTADNMYDEHLRAMVEDRYACDVELFHRAARLASLT
jgi:Sulfotransferase family